MIAARRLQRSFADGLIAEEVQDLWEPWMRHADEALNDDQLLRIIQQELSKRHKKSKTRGRPGTTAEVVLRMLLLKHMRGWSYEDVTREVRANLVYREFTGIGGGKVPDDKTMGRLARQLGPEAIEKLHRRTVTIALDKKVVAGRKQQLDEMIPRVQQVMQQTRERVLQGNTRAKNKILSVFEPHTELIRKGKASKPTEFGKMMKIQEAENQIVIHCEVFDQRPSDSDLLTPSLEKHQELLGRVPDLATADAGFFSAANEAAAKELGVKRVAIPGRSTKSEPRKLEQKKRWFKKAQKWRTGCEGRISVLKRRHGLNRSRYKGVPGIKRWVGLGVIADNMINIGLHLAGTR